MSKKYILLAAIAAFVLLLAQNYVLGEANPFPVSSPLMNFYRTSDNSQKAIIKFNEDVKKIVNEADKANTDWETKFNEIEAGKLNNLVIATALANNKAILELGKIQTPANISDFEKKSLEYVKKSLINVYSARFAMLISQYKWLSSHKEVVAAGENQAKILSAEQEFSKKFLAYEGLALDDTGFFMRIDKDGKIVERALNDAYTPLKGDVYNAVPFFMQAPGGGWYDTCLANACEEASLVQGYIWHKGMDFTDKFGLYTKDEMLQGYALRQILKMCDWQYENNDNHLYHDTSAKRTAEMWNKIYTDAPPAYVEENPTIDYLKNMIAIGHAILVPINGEKLLTIPPYKNPSKIPIHTIVLVGYNEIRQEFIVNDPGTWRGNGIRYQYEEFMGAIRDYKDGKQEKIDATEKRVVILPQKR